MCCVLCTQQHWERVDGSAATREHLMMLLADLKSIRIKAKYSEDTAETRSAILLPVLHRLFCRRSEDEVIIAQMLLRTYSL